MTGNLILIVCIFISSWLSGIYFGHSGQNIGQYYFFGTVVGQIIETIRDFSPGIFFGLAMAMWSFVKYKTNILKIITWIICSFIAYGIAIMVATYSQGGYIGFAFTGLIGALVLVFSSKLIMPNLSIKRSAITLFIGAICGVIFSIIFKNYQILSFVQWQLAVAIAMAFQFRKEIVLN